MSNQTNQKSPIFNTLLISIGTTTSKILGFIREVVIAAFFGASYFVDAYLIALLVPNALFSVVSGALTTTVIPLITEYKEKLGQKSVLTFLNTVTTVMAVVLAVLVLIGEVFAFYIIKLVAPGFEGEVLELAVYLSRIMFPMMLFMGLAGLGTGILQSQRRFFYPAFIGIPYNLIIIASLFLFSKMWGITGLAVGTLLGIFSQWLFQIPDLRKAGFRFKFKLDFSHPGFRKMGVLIIPVIIGSGAGQINLLVDRMLASGLVEGSISALNYASKVNTLAFGIIAVSVASAMYPEFSQAAVLKDNDKFVSSVRRTFNGLLLIILPFTLGMIILREPLIRLFFERGAFDEVATSLTVFALFFYALGLPALALREVILRAFYSLQDTMTPMIIGVGTVVLNIILNLILVRYLAHGGLALATSISITIGLFVLLWYLRKKVGKMGGSKILVSGLKITFATIVMGIVVYGLLAFLSNSVAKGNLGDFIILSTCGLVGAGIYFVIIKLLKVEEFDWLVDKVKVRFNR